MGKATPGRQGGGGGGGGQQTGRGGSRPEYLPNDDRSNVKNDNHPSYDADQANREKRGRSG